MQTHHPINVEALLTHIPLFNGLAPEEISRIARSTREIHASKGDILFHKGDACNGFHLLVYGQVKLAFTSQQGSEKVVEILQQPQRYVQPVGTFSGVVRAAPGAGARRGPRGECGVRGKRSRRARIAGWWRNRCSRPRNRPNCWPPCGTDR